MHYPVLFAAVPVTVLLTVSFFVLFVREKVQSQGLKSFGLVVAILLWLSSAIVAGGGIVRAVKGGPGMMHPGMMHRMMDPRMMEHRMQPPNGTNCPPECPMKHDGRMGGMMKDAPKK
ncbi:MAG: hypothetical protein HZC28_15985 [Spirochaetes bacterium]|nr:hypothetical protein [Spirochaetota bacterium]